MHPLSSERFFSLAHFSHRDLWQEGEPVWAALERLEAYLKEKKLCGGTESLPKSVYLERPELIFVGRGTIVEPGVMIEGPCVLGEHCIVRHGAYLRGGVVCGQRCVIGHGSEIKHSILLDGANVAHLGYVGDSILGNRVNLGAGVKCANLRLDRREVTFYAEGQKFRTGLKKLGCVVGDRCQIGCNVVLNPGTFLGPDCASYPLLNLSGVIGPRTLIKSQAPELHFEPLQEKMMEWVRL